MATAPLTMGVEEEFLVVDTRTRRPTPLGPTIRAAVRAELAIDVQKELSETQVEFATDVCTGLAELHAELVLGRRILDAIARRHGGRLVASGTPPLGPPGPPPLTDAPRYHRMTADFGATVDQQGVCGCHVHIGIPDLERAVLVSNHLRPWLPALLLLSANSPFCDGSDTGHMSWRSTIRACWPVYGVPPYFQSVQDYQELVGALVATGVLIDPAMIYWHVRPSSRIPTIEIRVADTMGTAAEAVVYAGLVRALVELSLAEVERGVPAPRPSGQLLRAACWQAGRVGLTGACLDPMNGNRVTGWTLVGQLLRYVRPALVRTGDLALVTGVLATLRTHGCGATRQRAAAPDGGMLEGVVDFLVEQTQLGTLD
jgi:glutamate---cysteine ligase / carboxylate-amine ligase